MKACLKKAVLIIATLGLAYLASFWFFMVKDCPALDRTNTIRYLSTLRGHPKEIYMEVTGFDEKEQKVRSSRQGIIFGEMTGVNSFYFPIDAIYYKLFPSHFVIGSNLNSTNPLPGTGIAPN